MNTFEHAAWMPAEAGTETAVVRPYADIPDESASGASFIASTAQQLAITFGVAIAEVSVFMLV